MSLLNSLSKEKKIKIDVRSGVINKKQDKRLLRLFIFKIIQMYLLTIDSVSGKSEKRPKKTPRETNKGLQ